MLQVTYGSHISNGWYWDKEYSGSLLSLESLINLEEKNSILYGRLIKITLTDSNAPPPFLVRRCENTKKIILPAYKDLDLTNFNTQLENNLNGFTFVGYINDYSAKEYNFEVESSESGQYYLFVDPNEVKNHWDINKTDYYLLSNNNYILIGENDVFNPNANYYTLSNQINVLKIMPEQISLNTLGYLDN